MAGPVISIGPQGDSSFALPNYAPISQGGAALGQGLAQLMAGVGQGFKQRKADGLLEAFMAAGQSGANGWNQDAARAFAMSNPAILDDDRATRAMQYFAPDPPPTPTDDMREYEFAKGQGFGGTFQDWQDRNNTPATTERRILKGADGFNYYADTGERVLPGVDLPPTTDSNHRTATGRDGILRWLDGPNAGQPVFTDEAGNPLPDAGAGGDDDSPPEKPGDIRKEFTSLSQTFIDTQDSFRRVLVSAERASATGDLALIFNFMKTLDPESVVRESEFRVAASAGDFGERIQATVNQLLDGTRLTPEQRADFVATARAAYEGQLAQQQRRRAQYTEIANSYGYTPASVLVNFIEEDLLPDGQPRVDVDFPAVDPSGSDAGVDYTTMDLAQLDAVDTDSLSDADFRAWSNAMLAHAETPAGDGGGGGVVGAARADMPPLPPPRMGGAGTALTSALTPSAPYRVETGGTLHPADVIDRINSFSGTAREWPAFMAQMVNLLATMDPTPEVQEAKLRLLERDSEYGGMQ